ncbi:MAG: hypothetical protein EAX86_06775 [Candidatus Heimdallarchaeota archaeon]|nr:hypothetical protein [Candidatus Heimdallarchaeota archaeon]
MMFVRFAISTDAGIEVWSYSEESSKYTLQDPQLISGFMVAIQNFSEAVIQSAIQEIRFSDLIIYVRTYRTFGLYLFLKEKIQTEEVERYFDLIAKETFQLLKDQDKGYFPESEMFEKLILPILSPLTRKNQEFQLSQSMKKPVIRIALLGLSRAGKTSMIQLFFKKESKDRLHTIKPTIGVVQHIDFEEFLKENILILDFGGQELYRRQYLKDMTYWGKTSTLIYVVDIQDPVSFLPALDYLDKLWSLVRNENESNVNLSIFLHKYDPEKRIELNKNIQIVLKHFKDYLKIATFFLTSVNDQSSNIALLQTIYFSLPDVMLQKLLNDELLDYFEQVILPQFTILPTLGTSQEDFTNMLPSIQQGVRILGTGYAILLQKSWLNYLKGDWNAKPLKLTSKSFIMNRRSQSIELTVQDWKNEGIPSELTDVLLTGFLEGILKTFHIESPKIINKEERHTTWEIRF